MSVYIPSDNKLLVCPYDEAHKVKESRFQLHITKCRLNHLDLNKKICPFNASHLLPVGEYDHHLVNCPDRAPLDRQLAQSVDKNNPFKGRTDVPAYSDPLFAEEIWEVDTSVVELPPPPVGAIVEPPAMAKPSERKRLYKALHQLPSGTENGELSSTPKSQAAKPSSSLRQPKQLSEGQNLQMSNAQMLQSLGLGRGKPSSRIAANFPKANDTSENLYSNMVKDLSHLGLGRGKPASQGAAAVNNYDDDEFPALGCGRGIKVTPKQNLRSPGTKPERFCKNVVYINAKDLVPDLM